MSRIFEKAALPGPIPVAILVRVSTAKQESDRQVFELRGVALKNEWQVVEVIQEEISGNAADSERVGIERAVELAERGKIWKVLVHEVSRVARRNSTAHRFVEDLESLGVSLYWHAQRIETLLPSGRRNPAASIMFSLLAEMARNERETLVERIQSGLAEAPSERSPAWAASGQGPDHGRKAGETQGCGTAATRRPFDPPFGQNFREELFNRATG